MARGGKRAGAGRPPGARNMGNRAIEALIERKGDQTPREFLLSVMNDASLPVTVRIDAAKGVAPFVHPRLANVEHSGPDGGALTVEIVQFALPLEGDV